MGNTRSTCQLNYTDASKNKTKNSFAAAMAAAGGRGVKKNLFFDASRNKNIGATICIDREIQCLPYAGFKKKRDIVTKKNPDQVRYQSQCSNFCCQRKKKTQQKNLLKIKMLLSVHFKKLSDPPYAEFLLLRPCSVVSMFSLLTCHSQPWLPWP